MKTPDDLSPSHSKIAQSQTVPSEIAPASLTGATLVTRIAPTPSGFLHAGNAANALLVHWLSRSTAARSHPRLALRIDDVDSGRIRPEYLADVFDVLTWLDIRWTVGPATVADYLDATTRSQHSTERDEHSQMREVALALRDATAIGVRAFVCRCTRRDVLLAGQAGCPADCARRNLPLSPGQTCVRLRITPGLSVSMGTQVIDLSHDHADPVIWRRDDLPAYHLATIFEDERLGTTHIVRGEDLRSSSALQVVLARSLGLRHAAEATYLHHALVTDEHGQKLSKSTLRAGHPMVRSDAAAADLRAMATRLGAPLGITPISDRTSAPPA